MIVWTVSLFADDILDWIPSISAAQEDCVDSMSEGLSCASILAVYQVTWSLFLFHFLMAVSLIKVTDTESARARWHTECWCVKELLYLIFFVTAFFLPYTFFVVFKWFALIGAIVFIFMQLFLLIDFAHSLNETWVEKHTETGGRIWVFALTGTSILSYALAVTFVILAYIFYSDEWTGPFFTTVNLVLCVLVTGLSLLPPVQNADRTTPVGILQSGVVSAYTSYLVLSGLMSQTSGFALISLTIVGSVIVVISVITSALSVSGSQSTYFAQKDDVETALNKERLEDAKEVPYSYSFFHVTFALGALYVCMLMTNWNLISDDASSLVIDHGSGSMWVKEASSWVVFLLYSWTLIAPVVLPNRAW